MFQISLFSPYVKSHSYYSVPLSVETKDAVPQTLNMLSSKTIVFNTLRNKLRTSVTINIILRNAASCNLARCADVSGQSFVSNFKVDGLKITWNHAAEFGSFNRILFLIL